MYEGRGPGNALQILQDNVPAALVPSTAGDDLHGVESGYVRVRWLRPRPREVNIQVRPTGTRVQLASVSTSASDVVRFPALDAPFRFLVGGQSIVVRDADAITVGTGLTTPPLSKAFLGPTRLQFSKEVVRRLGDCNKYDNRGLREVGISAQVERHGATTLRLNAREHSACVALPIELPRAHRNFRLRLHYRGVRGNPPRICVWQEGVNECAPLPALDDSQGWHRLGATVRPRTGTSSLHLFLYADGGGGTPTVTEYRTPVIEPTTQALAVAVEPMLRLPKVSYHRVSPSEFRVHVREARAPFLLVAAETFASGWRIDAPGRAAGSVTHVRVNGYANGWRIPWTGSYELTIEYGPERFARIARRVDLVAIPLGLLALLWRPTRGIARKRSNSPHTAERRSARYGAH
jgi:hypothetical protein